MEQNWDVGQLSKMLTSTGEIKPGITTGEYLLVASNIAIAERLDGIWQEMKKKPDHHCATEVLESAMRSGGR